MTELDSVIYQNAQAAIVELDRQAAVLRNAPYDPEDDSPYAEADERDHAARVVEHILGHHEGTEPGRRGPRSKRDLFCRLCQVNLAATAPLPDLTPVVEQENPV